MEDRDRIIDRLKVHWIVLFAVLVVAPTATWADVCQDIEKIYSSMMENDFKEIRGELTDHYQDGSIRHYNTTFELSGAANCTITDTDTTRGQRVSYECSWEFKSNDSMEKSWASISPEFKSCAWGDKNKFSFMGEQLEKDYDEENNAQWRSLSWNRVIKKGTLKRAMTSVSLDSDNDFPFEDAGSGARYMIDFSASKTYRYWWGE